MLLGDPHQATREHSASWNEIREIFGGATAIKEARLLTSYRSSPEVTALFASLLSEKEQAQLTSVQESGIEPIIQACSNDNYLDTLHAAAKNAAQKSGLTAIICADRQRAHWLARQLGHDVKLLSRDEALPAKGVIVMDLKLAKGLEFDRVIIPDAQMDVYPDTPIARRRLYTAISRATHVVEIYSQDKMSTLLQRT